MEKTVKAYAKINLCLDILGKLPNGYHEIETVMQQIPLYDLVSVKLSEGEGVEVLCDRAEVPTDERNTAYKAAKLFLEKANVRKKAIIKIEKNIPAAAGMAGGSADAAATIKALCGLLQNPLSNDEIMSLCKKVGADVPFCYIGGAALAKGIGEILTPIAPLENVFIVIAKPKINVSTAWAYQSFKAENVLKRPNASAVINAIKCGDLKGLAKGAANVFESVTEEKYGVISEYKKALSGSGAFLSMMSGSGPTVFGLFEEKQAAEAAYEIMKEKTADAFLLKI